MNKKSSSSSAWKWAVGCCAFILFFGSLALNIALGTLLASGIAGSLNSDAYNEYTIAGDDLFTDQKVARIDISGVIVNANEGGFSAPENSVEDIMNKIDLAIADNDVEGILFVIDSPGGSVTAAEDLHQKIIAAQNEGLAIVSYIHNSGTSGAYYAAAASDEILAHPTSLNGSIGVIIQSYNYAGLLEKIGVEANTFKSGEFKDILSGTRDVTDAERDLIQGLVDSSYDIFLTRILDNRDITEKELRAVADGRILTASQAKDAKLIDEVGYEDDALAKIEQLASITNYKLIEYQQNTNLFNEISQFPAVKNLPFFRGLLQGSVESLQVFYL